MSGIDIRLLWPLSVVSQNFNGAKYIFIDWKSTRAVASACQAIVSLIFNAGMNGNMQARQPATDTLLRVLTSTAPFMAEAR